MEEVLIDNYIDDFTSVESIENFYDNENFYDDGNLINNIFSFVDENNTNFKISEDEIIKKRLAHLEKKITPLFLSLIKSEDFEFGQKSSSIKLIQEQLTINKVATQNWFNDLYIRNFSSDEKTLIGLLRVIEYLDETLLSPTGQTIALASLSHKSDEVKELGVRIFENWSSINSYTILKGIKVDALWLQKYVDQVIKDLEVDLCLY